MRGQIAQVTGLFHEEHEGFSRGVEGLRAGNSASPASAVPGTSVLPVLPALAGLLPGGGLARGSVLSVEQPGLLCLALVAGASAAGAWCGVAGLPFANELTAPAKMELSSAVPIEPPTCCIVFTIADATPASAGSTP